MNEWKKVYFICSFSFALIKGKMYANEVKTMSYWAVSHDTHARIACTANDMDGSYEPVRELYECNLIDTI